MLTLQSPTPLPRRDATLTLANKASPRSGKLSSLRRFATMWFLAAAPWLMGWWLFADLGGHPLNDDPFYTKPIAWWATDGRLQTVRQHGELTASSLAHIWTGAVSVLGQPFNFRSLFLACIVQQALGVTAIAWAGYALRIQSLAIVSLSLAWISFPLFYGHAFTYMTDGPATAWAAVACGLFIVGIIRSDQRWLCLGSLVIGWSYWIRQTNVAVLMAPVVAICLVQVMNRRCLSGGLKPIVAIIALAGMAITLLESGWMLPSSVDRFDDVHPEAGAGFWKRAIIALYGWGLLVGWFSLPVSWMFLRASLRARTSLTRAVRRGCDTVALLSMFALLAPLTLTAGRASITSATGNFIQNGHFGPIFLSDMDEPGRWGDLGGVTWPAWFWQTLSLASIFSVGCLAWWAAWSSWRCGRAMLDGVVDAPAAVATGLLCMIAAASGAIALLIEPNMDRYWMFLLPAIVAWWLLILWMAELVVQKLDVAWMAACIGLNLSISIPFTHDMLAWNAARWRYVNAYLDKGHAPDSLDGGRDVNAWLRMDEDPNTSRRPGDDSTWWSGRAQVALAVGDRPGWHTIDRLPWSSWATGRTHYLLVLERDPLPAP